MNEYCNPAKKGAFQMKLKPVLKESLRLYKKNFPQLCLALLVELVLRAMALTPLLFLTDKSLAPLAWLSLPLYLLIALPARQNYALALQDMMQGGSVFTPQLISTKDYWKKLLRGLKGTLCILLWSSVTIAGVSLLYAAVMGLVDFITLMSIFKAIGGTVVDGIMVVAALVAASCVLIMLGCAVHSGHRHAVAMGNKALVKGNRKALIGLWFVGLLLVVPFAAVVAVALGDYAKMLIEGLMQLKLASFALNVRQGVLLIGGAVLLLYPVLPLKNLLPAVYLHMAKEKQDAAA